MRAGDFEGEALYAPAPSDLARAPLAQADDYTPAPACALGATWDYEAQRDAADVRWTAVAGRRRGGARCARVVRTSALAGGAR